MTKHNNRATKPTPNNVDILLVMAEAFDVNDWGEEPRAVFAHAQAQSRFGASIFWATRSTSRPNIESLLTAWQTTRDQIAAARCHQRDHM
jgi:hypothetical protein